jgi:hypothetical protein
MEPFSVGLAVAGATALVNAMVTDGWEGVRKKIGKLFGRGDEKRTEDALARLDRSHAELARSSGDDAAQARQQQAARWQTRFEDLLEEHPDAEKELRAILAQISAAGIGGQASIQQHVQAHDNARVAVQGQGVQHISFGDGERGE